VAYVILTTAYEASMEDGDGLTLASHAIYTGFLPGMTPRHALSAALLRSVYLPLEAAGLRDRAIGAFALVSHLSGAGVLWLLAVSIYPRFLRSVTLCFLCAVGTVTSFGVLSRATNVEVYAPALFLDVALIAFCLGADFSKGRNAVVAGLMYVAAIAIHVTNVLTGPLAMMIVLMRTPREFRVAALVRGASAFATGILILAALLWAGPGGAVWPPDLARIRPRSDPQPPMTPIGTPARAAYGFSRSLTFLPPFKELDARTVVPYVAALGGFALLACHLARGGALRRREQRPPFVACLAAVVLPFGLVGLAYYPSDPERWLFLTPVFWLVIGLLWDRYEPAAGARPSRVASVAILAAAIAGNAAYNVHVGLGGPARTNRYLPTLQALIDAAEPADLVVSPASIDGPILEFYATAPLSSENLRLQDLADASSGDVAAAQAALDARLAEALRAGRRVFVFDMYEEGHEKGRGYPWSYLDPRFGPESFLEVLDRFPRSPVVEPTRGRCGLFRLEPVASSP
jgi:hypothetical protein